MKKILITGGSGTVGSLFIKYNINKYKIYSYSRNEKSQVALKRAYPQVEIILGSVEDRNNLENIILKVKPHIIIHAAALKHVDTAEKQPIEMVKSNILGTKNIIELAVSSHVPITIGISTDKACSPNNLYGYSKLLMERMFMEASNEKNIFCCTRFGNVAGSNGSVIPFWLNRLKTGKSIPVTDKTMTRLMLYGKEVSEIIEECIRQAENKTGAFVLSKQMKSVNINDLAKQFSSNIEVVGLRPGEELSENLISDDELKFTRLEKDYIFITNEVNSDENTRLKVSINSENCSKMNSNELKNLIKYVENQIVNTMIY